MTREGAQRSFAARSRAWTRVFGVLPSRGRGGPAVPGGAGPLRRASGGAAVPRLRAGRRGARASGGPGDRARGHAEGNACGGGSAEAATGRRRRGRTSPARGSSAAATASWSGTGAADRARSTSWPGVGSTTVFVEVKERRNASHGLGLEAVTWSKRQRLVRAARLYAASKGLSETDLRFDVVSVDGRRGQPRAGCLRRRRLVDDREGMERETGFEPATSTLARSHSTTELFPPCLRKI